MRRQVVASVRAGESTARVAERLLDVGNPAVELPRHVRQLEKAARVALASGDRNVYLQAVDRWKGTIERLGSVASGDFSVRAATQQLASDLGELRVRPTRERGELRRAAVRAQASGDRAAFQEATRRLAADLQAAKAKQIDNIIDRWTLERARHQARTIARTETVDAYRDQYRRQGNEQPYVIGYRWVLSPRHPRADVCDVLASQDLDGLGPGGYLPESVPSTPHPSDLCSQVAIMDSQYFRRQVAAAKGLPEPDKPWLSGKRENGQEWLAKQPEKTQRELLGPTRLDAMKRGQKVLNRDGTPIPVHKVTGGPKPVQKRGPAVAAKPIVRRDRTRMVRPFPTVPR